MARDRRDSLRPAGAGAVGGIPGGDHGFESFTLVLEVALGGFDKIRDEVVAALQLHVDLGEGVLEAVLEGDEAIVLADRRKRPRRPRWR